MVFQVLKMKSLMVIGWFEDGENEYGSAPFGWCLLFWYDCDFAYNFDYKRAYKHAHDDPLNQVHP